MAPMGMGMEPYTNISLFLYTLKIVEKNPEIVRIFNFGENV